MSSCESTNESANSDSPNVVQAVQVYYTPLGGGYGKYRVTATAIPPQSATGIPKATVYVIGSGVVRKPIENEPMTLVPSSSTMYYVERFAPGPASGDRYYAEVIVDWQIIQRESANSPVKTMP